MPEGETEMTSGRGPAFVKSTQRHPAVKASKPIPPEVMFVLLLVDGILIGIVLSAILAMGLNAFGWLSFGGGLPAQAPEALYAPTPALFPICPTCDVSCGVTSTPASTPTSTPDFAATATQACSDWRSLFPATPCPVFVAPSP
jgi:hypothetical protein